MPSQELMQAVLALINADDDLRQNRVISEHANLLLTDDANQLPADWLEQSKGNEQYARVLQEGRDLLARYRHEATNGKPPSPPREKVRQTIQAFVKINDWDECQRLVLAKRELLLSHTADQIWLDLQEQYKSNAKVTRVLKKRRLLLEHCRSNGIEAAFAQFQQREQVAIAVPILLKTNSSAERQRLVVEKRDLLLTDMADQILADLQEQERDNAKVARIIQLRALLSNCRCQGIEQAFTQGKEAASASHLPVPANASELLAHLMTFISIKISGDAQATYLKQHPELLTDEALQVLNSIIEEDQAENDENLVRLFTDCRHLLIRCRREGIDATFAHRERVAEAAFAHHERASEAALAHRERVSEAVFAFLNTSWLYDRKRLIAARQNLLLTDTADQVLADLLWQYRGNENAIRDLQDQRALLARCRREGINAAFAEIEKRQWVIIGRIVFTVLFLLCGGPVWWITRWLSSNFGSGWAVMFVLFVIFITRLAWRGFVQLGIKAHIINELGPIPDELRVLLNEMEELTHPSDMPRRIEVCREALALVDRQTHPELWSKLQDDLGYSSSHNPLGERADNLEQAIHHYQQALEIITRQAFPKKWAAIQNNLAETYRERIRGVQADNLEQAISLYEQALQVCTRQTAPVDWAMIQQNLAIAYSRRIRGERADNLEQAIDYFKQALQVRTRQALPEKWATTQQNLALAYWERIRGKRADNLELAIRHSEQALQVITPQAFPDQWAGVQNNLAMAYGKRIRGERADNIEQAIDHIKQGQKVYTRQAFPEAWARSQHNLAMAYLLRIRGERADNLEEAIHHLKQALEVHTRQAFPEQWVAVQNDLANAVAERIRGERALNLEQAIYHSEQALDIYTRQDFPEQWALTQNNLALNVAERSRGERADNLEQAIHHFEQALDIYTRQAFPEQWAMTMVNLADVYAKRIHGEGAENIERAIDYLKQALEVRTRQDFPYEWAQTQNTLAAAYLKRTIDGQADQLEQAIYHLEQALDVYTHQAFPIESALIQNNLALAYWLRIHGERADNIKKAIHHAQQALQVYTPLTWPQRCRETALVLGLLLYEQKRFSEAREALVTAHQAVEALRGEVTREMGKRILSGDNAVLYGLLVDCCLREEDEKAAFEYAVAGKGRAFVDMLASTRFDIFAAEADDPALATDLQAYRELRQQVDNLRTRLTGRGTEIDEQLRKQEWELLRHLQRQELERWEDLAYKYPRLTATQSAPSLSVKEAQALASDLGATLVEFVQHTGGWSAFVVTNKAVRHVSLPDVNDEFLQEVKPCWTKIVERLIRDGYYNAEDFYTLEKWYEALIMPLKPHLPPSGKVVLAPAGVLHLIPLSIARDPDTLAYLCDEYALSFTPSLAALRVTVEEAKRKGATRDKSLGSLLAVAYPGELGQPNYLSHAVAEARAMAKHFPKVTSLYHKAATPQAVVEKAKGQAVAHFSCHGTFDSNLPEQSGLLLHDGFLTVQRIISELRLSDARLATLSACVTHRADVRAGEEHVGLVQSVLTAGAQSVVASLWSVPEGATRVLFQQFYSAVAQGEAPAQALTEAMRYVREQPDWEHPFYWAAFQVSGLGYDLEG